MLKIPELTNADVAFGEVKHMPKMADIPEDFHRHHGTPYNDAVSHWFFAGARSDGQDLIVDGERFSPRPGVDGTKALAAIRAVLGSFAPKHEHKEAACAYMLSEWFEHQPSKAA